MASSVVGACCVAANKLKSFKDDRHIVFKIQRLFPVLHNYFIQQRKRELNKLFEIANQNPQLAKQLIEGMVAPWSRSLVTDITAKGLNELSEVDLIKYYDDKLYRV